MTLEELLRDMKIEPKELLEVEIDGAGTDRIAISDETLVADYSRSGPMIELHIAIKGWPE